MKYTLLLLFTVLFSFSYAQYGWTDAKVILKNGEELNGEAYITQHQSEGMFKFKLWRKRDKLKFRTEKGAKKQQFKPEEVESIEFSHQYFSNKVVPVYLKKGTGKPVFMIEVFEGENGFVHEKHLF